MAEEITVRDNDEFEEIIANHDIRVARALVETILKKMLMLMLKTKKM